MLRKRLFIIRPIPPKPLVHGTTIFIHRRILYTYKYTFYIRDKRRIKGRERESEREELGEDTYG